MSIINTLIAAVAARTIELRSEKGQGLVEYALVVALIAVVSVLVLKALGVDVFTALDTTQKNFTTGAPAAPTP
jgi:Flp pilus assembly pilin Flp